MKRNWNEDELLEHFTLLPIERKLIGNKTGASRLGFTVLLKFFQQEARFPAKKQEIPKVVIEFIAHQLGLPPMLFEEYRWGGQRKEILPIIESKLGNSSILKSLRQRITIF